MVTTKYSRDGRSPIPKSAATSRVMSSNKAKNTKPEIFLRKCLWGNNLMGYRLHPSNLPGKPDIAYIGRKIAIFVNGCFWHGHKNCPDGHIPNTNFKYWRAKIDKNIMRDRKNVNKLKRKGWVVVIIWVCDLKKSTQKQIERIRSTMIGIGSRSFCT